MVMMTNEQLSPTDNDHHEHAGGKAQFCYGHTEEVNHAAVSACLTFSGPSAHVNAFKL